MLCETFPTCTYIVMAMITLQQHQGITLFCLISAGHHLELRIAITF